MRRRPVTNRQITPHAASIKPFKRSASSAFLPRLRKALPAMAIGMAAALVVKLVADSQLGRSRSGRSVARVGTGVRAEGNGHHDSRPERLAPFL
ncbi:MAG: hypothetical protein M3164_02305 [Actinomycetota bacterium]|nr:hypothetical protein [Actinomycetota bacterium]